ncbi:MAG: HupE/UreJ family protein [Pseudomonadota bacterium]
MTITVMAFRAFVFALICCAVAVCLSSAQAHDIPADIAVQAYIKPAGERLRLLVRVPLKAMRDVDYPRRDAGLIDLARVTPALHEAAALWIADNVRVYENDQLLAAPHVRRARISLAADKAFAAYESALAHVQGARLPAHIDIYWEQALLDVLIEYPMGSEHSEFSIHPRLERLGLRTTTVLRFVAPNGVVRVFEYHGDAGRVRLDPRWHHAALRFVQSGFTHILTGADHLLFLLCLVLPFRRLGPLIMIVTAFTIAHSITLIAAAVGLGPGALWFAPFIETLIAVSILYMALENIIGANLRWRGLIACAFGLVHGFAFSFELKQTLQFAGEHLVTSLLAFNVGVELGQILMLILCIPILNVLFKVIPERIGIIIISVFVGHAAWHWMIERAEQLRRFPFPAVDPATLASLTRWLMALVALAAIGWLVTLGIRSRRND